VLVTHDATPYEDENVTKCGLMKILLLSSLPLGNATISAQHATITDGIQRIVSFSFFVIPFYLQFTSTFSKLFKNVYSGMWKSAQ
jgi:hypothetical protein